MRRIVLAVAALLVSGCATVAAEVPPGEPVAMKRSSWGKPLAEWRIEPSGQGWFKASRAAEPKGFFNYDLVTRRFSAGPDAYRRVAALLEPARAFAGRDIPCESRATDLPYGTVSWGESQLTYDSGCMGADAGRVIDALKAAEDHVESLAADAPIADVEEVRQPQN